MLILASYLPWTSFLQAKEPNYSPWLLLFCHTSLALQSPNPHVINRPLRQDARAQLSLIMILRQVRDAAKEKDGCKTFLVK